MSVINQTKLAAVLQMSQKHLAQLLQMIDNMLDNSEHIIAQIQQNAKLRQYSELQQTLHKIRGGYATLGAENLAAVSKTLEHRLETSAAVSATEIAEFIATYRQTCVEMRAELTRYRSGSALLQHAIDIKQLHTMLIQQDMQACQIAQTNKEELIQILGASFAREFFQYISALTFTRAAQMLEPHLAPNRRKQP